MKIKLAGLALFTLFVAGANAQNQNLSFGPTAGFGHTWLSNVPDAKYQPAGNVGLTLTYSSLSHFGLGTALKYSIEGGRTENSNTETTVKLDYLRIPVTAIYFFGEYGNKLRPKVAVGPSFGFLIGGKQKTELNGSEISNIKSTDLYKGFDVGLTASAGLNYRLVGNTWFVADVNYYNGLSDISDVATTSKIRNRNLGLNIGVNFGIGNAK